MGQQNRADVAIGIETGLHGATQRIDHLGGPAQSVVLHARYSANHALVFPTILSLFR
jgi:hypothetical protein